MFGQARVRPLTCLTKKRAQKFLPMFLKTQMTVYFLLGYDISQTLFIGPNNLIVEGVSDLLFIQTISGVLEEKGRTLLSVKWTITPVGGSDKVPTFVALLSSQKGLNVATLLDIQQKDQQSIENLYKKKLLEKQNVFTYGDFLDRNEADVEDYFGDEFYISLVNGAYKNEMEKPIVLLNVSLGNPRITRRLEEYFKSSPLTKNYTFNHYRPARYFVDNVASLSDSLPGLTLDLFEATFDALNKCIKN